MTVDPAALARMFLVSLLCGAALELLWEGLGIVGCALRYRRGGSIEWGCESGLGLIIIFIKDMLYFVAAGVVVSVLIYWMNDGQFRFLALAGLFAGFFSAYFTIGRLLRRLTEGLVILIFRLLGIILYPLTLLRRLIARGARRIAGYARVAAMRRRTIAGTRALNSIKERGMPD